MNLHNSFTCALFTLSLLVISEASGSIGYVADLSGDVKMVSRSAGQVEAHRLDKLEPGITVKTGQTSYAILKFEDGHYIALKSNTSFFIERYDFEPNQVERSSILFSLLQGGLRSITGLIGERNQKAFKLNTPFATIGIRGTDFLVAMHSNAGARALETAGLYLEVIVG